VVSGGRAILGIGAGWFEREHHDYGYEFGTFTERFQRLEESLQIIGPMLRGEEPTFNGDWYHVENALNNPRLRPSIPIMLGTAARPQVSQDKRIAPIEQYGIRLMSMGFFLDEQSPVIWRGPIVMGIIRQFVKDVDWAGTDVLVVDLPPGTGDAPLTLVQQVPVTGGVIVTSPQDVALLDVGRGIAMFAQVQTPVLGIVENMAGYTCPSCGTHDAIFGEGGGARLAAAFDLPLLGRIPLVPAVRVAGDAGKPIVLADPHGTVAEAFHLLARRVLDAAAGVATAAPLGVAPA